MKRTSVIIIAKDEERVITDALKSVRQLADADEVILIDNGSTDKTASIARKYGARIFSLPTVKLEFAKLRNFGLKKAQGEWLLYLDADERITPELADEIKNAIRDEKYVAYEIPRRNFYLGKEVCHGGAWPDYVKRLFLKKNLQRWERDLHEDPVYKGKIGRLKAPFIHKTHRNLSEMVEKTKDWSKIESQLLYEAGHSKMTWWRLLRPMISEFWQRGIKRGGLLDGAVGWIEVLFQMFSRFMTYARLWELQQKQKRN